MSMRTPDSTNETPRPRFSLWALFPVALLGGLMSLVGTLVVIATRDPGFAVEPDYYQKAVDWDARRALEARSAALGWKAAWSFDTEPLTPDGPSAIDAALHAATPGARVTLTLTDAAGRPVDGATVQVTALHNARANAQQALTLSELDAGRYSGSWLVTRDGLWEFRLTVMRSGEHFTATHRAELSALGGAQGERR